MQEATKTTTTPNPTRRALFGASAAILLLAAPAAGAAKARELDGELLAACAEYQATQAAVRTLTAECPHGGSRAHDDMMDSLTDREAEALEWIMECDPPRTPEGLRAKAAVAHDVLYSEAKPFADETLEQSASRTQMLALSVFADVMGRA